MSFRFLRALPPGASRSRRDERHSIRWTLPGRTTYLPRPRRRRLRSATKAKCQCWLSAKLVCDALDRAIPDAERPRHLQDSHALRKLLSHLPFGRAIYLRPAELHALGDGAADRPQSTLMLRARITLPHFSVSSAMSFAKSAGEPGSASPRSARRTFILGSARAALTSLLSCWTISAGVFLGTPTPYHDVAS